MPNKPGDEECRKLADARIDAMREDRYSWWVHWAELARFILPRRYRWLVTQNQMNRGQQINTAIIDSTGTVAARVLASGMMSGMTSPTRQWFQCRIEGFTDDESHPVNVWLMEVRSRMMRVFQESNFYNAIAVVYMDMAVFGTAPMLIYEDFDNVIHCVNPCAGEYFVANNDKGEIGVFAREFVQTVSQLVKWFGEENCSKSVQEMYKRGGAELQQEIVVRHLIEPNEGRTKLVPEKFAYREMYWEKGVVDGTQFLKKAGYHECPFICPRWDISGNDAYGRSPGMDALGDIKQLQMETKRKAQVIDKMANPPMVADVELKNKPASTIPGGVTYVTKKDGAGFAPAYSNFRPPINELMVDIQDVRTRIKEIFFNDLFLMFQQLEAEPRSATAIDARREEKMVMLGPVFERFQTEALDKIIDRVFGMMDRAGILPEAPQEIENRHMQVEYVSMLAAAQRAVETAGIERLFGFVGNIAALVPDAVLKLDIDYSTEKYSSLLNNDPRLLKPQEEVEKKKAESAKQQQLAYQTEMGLGAAKAGKTLSETDVGGGVNAMQAILGTGGQ